MFTYDSRLRCGSSRAEHIDAVCMLRCHKTVTCNTEFCRMHLPFACAQAQLTAMSSYRYDACVGAFWLTVCWLLCVTFQAHGWLAA
jgi:hypothetical protein